MATRMQSKSTTSATNDLTSSDYLAAAGLLVIFIPLQQPQNVVTLSALLYRRVAKYVGLLLHREMNLNITLFTWRNG